MSYPAELVVRDRYLDFKDAVELLQKLTIHLDHPLAHHRERLASITHWLQNPQTLPLFGDELLRDEWVNCLQRNASTSLRPANCASLKTAAGSIGIAFDELPLPPITKPSFTFIDLFAGIGGFRLALQSQGGKCIFSSELDEAAQNTYFKNYGEVPFGDINQFTGMQLSDDEVEQLIPDHDVLAAGFPCQPFSLAGVSARTSLGKKHGFACETQGTLFFNIVRIAHIKKPKVLFLENVKNLLRHDGGKTFEIIKNTIENELGYSFKYSIINSSSLVPQRRERCYIVAFRDGEEFAFPDFEGPALPLKSILEDSPAEKYTISDKLWLGHINRTKRNLERGTGFTAFAADINKPANTLVARYGKDGKECLIPQEGKNPRKLTPRECARLQGFPENFILPKAASPAYKQFGNSVAVPVVTRVAEEIAAHLKRASSEVGRSLIAQRSAEFIG